MNTKPTLLIAILLLGIVSCQKKIRNENSSDELTNKIDRSVSAFSPSAVDYWLTKGDQSVLLQQQSSLSFGSVTNRYANITVDTTQVFQSVDGFGYTLTTGSA